MIQAFARGRRSIRGFLRGLRDFIAGALVARGGALHFGAAQQAADEVARLCAVPPCHERDRRPTGGRERR